MCVLVHVCLGEKKEESEILYVCVSVYVHLLFWDLGS